MQKSNLWSKTNGLALLTFIAGLCTYLAGTDLVNEYPSVPGYFLMASGIAGVMIRQLTDKPVRALFGWRR